MRLDPARLAVGITLIEMMIAVAILAILVAIAAPNMNSFFISNRLSSGVHDFMTALQQARSEAIRRGANVVMRRAGTTAQNWTQGWEMFVDLDGNKQRDTAAGSAEELIRVGQQVSGSMTLHASTKAATAIVFVPSGRVEVTSAGVNPAFGEAMFVLCLGNQTSSGGQSRSRAVIVNAAGGVRLAAADASGQPLNESTGAAVTSCTNPTY